MVSCKKASVKKKKTSTKTMRENQVTSYPAPSQHEPKMVCQNQSKLPTLTHDTYTEHIPVHLEMDNIGNYILSLIHITYIYIHIYIQTCIVFPYLALRYVPQHYFIALQFDFVVYIYPCIVFQQKKEVHNSSLPLARGQDDLRLQYI